MATKNLEKRIEKLERKLANLKKTIYLNVKAKREIKEPNYKVGDYIKFIDTYDHVHNEYLNKGEITCVFYDQSEYGKDKVEINGTIIIDCDTILGYSEPSLLMQKEKEYLKNIIKATGKEVRYIRKIIKDGYESLEIYLFEELLTLSYIEINKHYHRLKLNKFYNKKELGL